MSLFSPSATGGMYGHDLSGAYPGTTTLTSENRFQQLGRAPVLTSEQSINQQRLDDAHRMNFMNQMQNRVPGPVAPMNIGRPSTGFQLPGMGNMMQPPQHMNDQMMYANSANARMNNMFGQPSMTTPFNTQRPGPSMTMYPGAARVQPGLGLPSTQYPSQMNIRNYSRI